MVGWVMYPFFLITRFVFGFKMLLLPTENRKLVVLGIGKVQKCSLFDVARAPYGACARDLRLAYSSREKEDVPTVKRKKSGRRRMEK